MSHITDKTMAILGADPAIKNAGTLPIRIRVPKDMRINGDAKWWTKNGKLYGCVEVESGGMKFLVSARVPLAPIRAAVKRSMAKKAIELGWDPFGAIKDGASWLGNTVKDAATSKVASKLTDIVQSPTFQSVVTKAAPVFGVPPGIAEGAFKLVNAAGSDDIPEKMKQAALGKVKNITAQASQGFIPAQKLWSVMSTYFRQGIPGLMQAPPYFPMPQMPQMPQMPYGMPQMPYGAPPYGGSPYGGSPYGMPQMPYGGLQRLQVPTPWGQISGWVYNVPYRSPIQTVLKASEEWPGMGLGLRSLYYKGMKG